jgi:ATP-dependent Lon protease
MTKRKINDEDELDETDIFKRDFEDIYYKNNGKKPKKIVEELEKKKKQYEGFKVIDTYDSFLEHFKINPINETSIIDQFINVINVKNNNNNLKDIENALINYGISKNNKYDLSHDNKIKLLKEIENLENNTKDPLCIKLLSLKTTDMNKKIIMQYYSYYARLMDHDSEKNKYLNWLLKISNYPFGISIKPAITSNDDSKKKKNYLKSIMKEMNLRIYGHKETKQELLKLIAQSISNDSTSLNIGLEGSKGTGKTEIIKNAMSKIINRPFQFISLSGIHEGSYLNGHSFSYSQSICGKIVDAIIQSKCDNPIIFFDELDKTTLRHGVNEIENILIHVIDSSQNKSFQDLYFQGIEFDLSKVTFIFSFNDSSKISPILLDRIKIIQVQPYDINDKLILSQKYLIPTILKEIGLKNYNNFITDEIIKHIIYTYTNEHGVRKLRECLKDLLMTYNLNNLLNDSKPITIAFIDDELFRTKHKYMDEPLNFNNKIGCVNGMWASDSTMVGGVIQIETKYVYSTENFKLILTGNVKKVMNESVEIAKTVAWNLLTDAEKKQLINKWKDMSEGIHVNFVSSIPKDGPSAGTAIALCIYSLLTNKCINQKYAITGEITQNGDVKKIGGLEQKILGSKLQGIKHILCPYENKDDLDDLIVNNKDLFDDGFTIDMVKHISEVIKKVVL